MDNLIRDGMAILQDRKEETGSFSLPQNVLPPIKNYAADPDVIRQVQEDVLPACEYVRRIRVSLEDEWRSILRMKMMIHDGGRRYFGRSDAYLPIYAKNSQTLTSAITRGLFPSDEYLDVMDRNGDSEKALRVKAAIQWEFDRVARLRNNVKPWIQQLVDLGNSPLKIMWKQRTVRRGKLRMNMDLGLPEPLFATDRLEGLQVSYRSMLSLYMWPTSAASLDECTLIFEDIEVPRQVAKERIEKGIWQNTASALTPPIPANYILNQSDIHSNVYGMSPPATPAMGGNRLGSQLVYTEVWTFMRLPADAYLDHEDKQEPLPVKLTLAGGDVIECIRNPFFHQQAPYRLARMNVQPGLFYGYGAGRLARTLQYLANDFANQANDCGIYSMNPILKVNPTQLVGPLRPLAPGVPWYMTDPNAVTFDRPPPEIGQTGLAWMQTWMGMAQDFGGAPPLLQGQGASRSAKTATGAQILQRNAMMPLQDVVEDLEQDVFVPLMYMTHALQQQFRDQAIITAVAGQPLKVDPADLVIDPEFLWMGSSQASNQAQRAQQAMQFVQGIMPLVPLLAQQGYVFNPVPVLQRIWNDGLGFRNFDKVVEQNPQAAQAMMAAGQPPPGQDQPQPADRVRSALEQITGQGGANPMAPGEGEDFMEMRSGADDLAALFGQSGGGNNNPLQ